MFLLLCAGWKNKINMEDTLFGGAVIDKVNKHFTIEQDACIAAHTLYQCSKHDLFGTLKNASHYKRLSRLGIDKDIEYCLQVDQLESLPIFKRS